MSFDLIVQPTPDHQFRIEVLVLALHKDPTIPAYYAPSVDGASVCASCATLNLQTHSLNLHSGGGRDSVLEPVPEATWLLTTWLQTNRLQTCQLHLIFAQCAPPSGLAAP